MQASSVLTPRGAILATTESDSWYKRLVYVIVAFTLIMASINLTLNIWIIRVLRLSRRGIGPINLSNDGMAVYSDAGFLNTIRIDRIQRLYEGNGNIEVNSAKSVNFEAFTKDKTHDNILSLGGDTLISKGSHFLVRNQKEGVLFRTDPGEVVVAADNLKISTKAGFQLDGSLHSEIIRGSPSSDLRVESPMEVVTVRGDANVTVESKTEKINLEALNDVLLSSLNGNLIIDSMKSEIKRLRVTKYRDLSHAKKLPRTYHVCSCESGKIFLVSPGSQCVASTELCS